MLGEWGKKDAERYRAPKGGHDMGFLDRLKGQAEDLSKKAKPMAEQLKEKAKPLAEKVKDRSGQAAKSAKESAEGFRQGLHGDGDPDDGERSGGPGER